MDRTLQSDIKTQDQAIGEERAALLRPGEAARQFDALCLSGGGIRSATFCLGVMQGLAREKLLLQFDYLSTVSGGGYIGGWLQSWLKAVKDPVSVQDALAAPSSGPLERLRGYTNYLTPQSGPASADIWAGVALFTRNIVLNWLVFLPVLGIVVLVAVMHRTASAYLAVTPWAGYVVLAIAAGALGAGAFTLIRNMPGARGEPLSKAGADPRMSVRQVVARAVVPTLGWALLTPVVVAGWLIEGPLTPDRQLAFAALHIVVTAGAVIAAGAYKTSFGRMWLRVALVPVALAQWLALRGLEQFEFLLRADPMNSSSAADVTSVVGPLVLLLPVLLQTTLTLGHRQEAKLADIDREWFARVNGLILAGGVAWTLYCISCLVLPAIFILGETAWTTGKLIPAAGGSLMAGVLASWLGQKVVTTVQTQVTSAVGGWLTFERLIQLLAMVFGVGLLAALGALEQSGLGWLQLRLAAWGVELGLAGTMQAALDFLPLPLQAALMVVLIAWVVRFRDVNVNRFSLHAIYRNRIVRGFFGSTRAPSPAPDPRAPEPFTDFDPRDNPHLADLQRDRLGLSGPSAQWRGLFPVINMTLNTTSAPNPAVAERKAMSFTATPLHCGAGGLSAKGSKGAFVATECYAFRESPGDRTTSGGLSLGTAVAISGAAASPNWGYHSSPVTAFLMTLFNVRLGAWLPNPAAATPVELTLAKPRNSLTALLSELAGLSDARSQAVYLSDGGHFDNLGLYEMLRRKCRRIVVVDAGQDEVAGFADLGMAIRRAEVDFGVRVTLDKVSIASRAAVEKQATGAARPHGIARGAISYPKVNEDDPGEVRLTGALIYLKPTLVDGVPMPVRAYLAANETFPHETTADQWFSESQFESYRALGECQMAILASAMPTKPAVARTLDDLFAAAKALLP